jgi:uncharacterized OB-fold protein
MSDMLSAEYVLEYTYRRSVGPVIGRFLGGLRDRKIEGARTASGKVLVPPPENDPETGDAITEFVSVGDTGVVTTWAWVPAPRKNHPLQRPFAWALVKLAGADSAILHAVDAVSAEAMSTGMRVKVRWKEQRVGAISDIACFEPMERGAS